MKQQVNTRLPERSQEQLHYLLERTGMTQTQIIIAAIEKLWQAVHNEAAVASMSDKEK